MDLNKDLNKKVFFYSTLAFGITWTIAFGIFWLHTHEIITESQLDFYHAFAAIGPAIAAFLTIYYFYGKHGIIKIIEKLRFYFPKGNAIIFIVSPLLFFMIGLLVFRIVKAEHYDFALFATLNWDVLDHFIIWLLPLFSYSILEEIGWRGFLLPHLQSKYNAWKSTLILTFIWALWHLPFFFYRFNFSIGIAIGFFFGIFVGALILTSIYNSSKGFLVPVMIFHFLNNFCSAFDKEIVVAVLSTGFVFIAIYIYKKYGVQNLSLTARQQNYFRV